MARQKGIIKLKGTIGDITFYKTQDGHLAREKGGIDASRIKNDPAFQRTRENGSEFGRAGKAGKTLRTALRTMLMNSADSRMVSRLTQAMMKVIQADSVSERGLRNVIDGEAELLTGFEFNIGGKLGTSLFVPYTVTIDRVSGEITVDFESFVPANLIAAPSGTTHFKLISAGAEVDFENETYVVDNSSSDIIPWDFTSIPALPQINELTPNSTKPMFLIVGVEFYQEINGQMYPLKNGAYNPLAIVKVDSGVLMVIFLTRTYFPDGTNGKLICEGKTICNTIELPWKNNEKRVSCIPEGRYFIRKRYSQKFKWHLEITGVSNRNLILFHPANNALLELNGCIAPVTKLSGPGLGLMARKAFTSLKDLVYKTLDRNESVELIVES